MAGIVALITDFGHTDPYVGSMKGVILSIAPSTQIIDISHSIRPQDIVGGAFTLSTSFQYFPFSTVFLAIVDPGVGGKRAGLLIETDRGIFIGPDNGVLSWATGFAGQEEPLVPQRAKIQRIIRLTNSRFWLPNTSTTFHGRDIFAPVAAHLVRGVPISDFGTETASYEQVPWPPLHRTGNRQLRGSIIHIDHFGNLVTNIPSSEMEALGGSPTIEIADQTIVGLSQNYERTGLLALVGSAGYLEISVANGNAAAALGITRGADVTVR